jgi:hypothetical protein
VSGHKVVVHIAAGVVRTAAEAVRTAAEAVHKAAAVVPTGFAAAVAGRILGEPVVDSIGFEEPGLSPETWGAETWGTRKVDTLGTWAAGQVVVVVACCIEIAPGEDMATMVLHTDWS